MRFRNVPFVLGVTVCAFFGGVLFSDIFYREFGQTSTEPAQHALFSNETFGVIANVFDSSPSPTPVGTPTWIDDNKSVQERVQEAFQGDPKMMRVVQKFPQFFHHIIEQEITTGSIGDLPKVKYVWKGIEGRKFPPSGQFAYVTRGFPPAIKALAVSLLYTKTRYPLVVMGIDDHRDNATATADLESLKAMGISFHITPVFEFPPEVVKLFEHQHNWIVCYSKLYMWTLPYQKVVWLDHDMIVMENIDDLFWMPELSATMDVTFGHCSLGTGDQSLFAGILVAQPNPGTFEGLKALMKPSDDGTKWPWRNAEQSMLDYWFQQDSRHFTRLPPSYAYTPNWCRCDPPLIPDDTIKILHYTYHPRKPWDDQYSVGMPCTQEGKWVWEWCHGQAPVVTANGTIEYRVPELGAASLVPL